MPKVNPTTITVAIPSNSGPPANISDTDVDITDPDDTAMATLTLVVGGLMDGPSEILNIGGTDFPLDADSTTTVIVGLTTFNVAYTAGTARTEP